MPARLPLFPLDLVLFPGEYLPLHIFEPRYRQLLEDCLAGDQRFGLTVGATAEAGSVGTVARIHGAESLPDGRSNIIVVGESRFGVRTLLPDSTPYLVAAVEPFADLPESAALPAERAELVALAEALRRALTLVSDSTAEPAPWDEADEGLSFQVAGLLESDPAVRAPLHRERATRRRIQALVRLLPARVHAAETRAAVHVRSRTNGHGHAGHDIVTG